MKTGTTRITIFLLGLVAIFSSCSDPILFIISKEPPPQDPIIPGAPTNMVVFKRDYPDPVDPGNQTIEVPILCVASGQLYWYAKYSDGSSRWNLREYNFPQPPGNVFSLAATADYLYALTLAGGVNTSLYRIHRNHEAEWQKIETDAGNYTLQLIYADPDQNRVFAGGSRNDSDGDSFGILYLHQPIDPEGTPTMRLLEANTSLLSGTAYRASEGIHYLSTRAMGIFQISEWGAGDPASGLQPHPGSSSHFTGMLKLKDTENTIIAVVRDGGDFYKVSNGSSVLMTFSEGAIQTGSYSTGALALWTCPYGTGRKLIVAGIQGTLVNTTSSSYTHGYVEFNLNSDDTINESSSRRNPGNLLSVESPDGDGNDSYRSTIGIKPINHLFQAPLEVDSNMTFFASTQNSGLWSFKDRGPDSGGWQWNAEN